MQWMGLANDYHHRPPTSAKPTWFDNGDDSTYKLESSATGSYVLGTDGTIVPGPADVVYDDRTADTHLLNFVLDLMRAVQQDYGITQPDMSYTSVNSNEYDHETRWATPNANGVLPGRAYAHGGMAPEVLNAAGTRVITGGMCVSVGEVTGGMIGYRPMLATEYV